MVAHRNGTTEVMSSNPGKGEDFSNKIWFWTFFVDFSHEITEKGLKSTKMLENGWKKVVRPAFGCAQHPKAGQNTQHTGHLNCPVFRWIRYSGVYYSDSYFNWNTVYIFTRSSSTPRTKNVDGSFVEGSSAFNGSFFLGSLRPSFNFLFKKTWFRWLETRNIISVWPNKLLSPQSYIIC